MKNKQRSSSPGRPDWGMIIKRSILYGAALGLIIGLVDRAIRGDGEGEVAAIIRWREFIIAGAVLGGILGSVFAWLVVRSWRKHNATSQTPAPNPPTDPPH